MKAISFWKGSFVREKRLTLKIIPLVFILLLNLPLSPTLSLDYFPTNGWRVSTPEEQGINSTNIDKMNTEIKNNDIGIDSIIVIRNGYLVHEAYFDYYNYSTIHLMWSVTMSITSILIGIANATGFIPNLDQPVLELFPDRTFTNVDAKKQAITIRHLLKMQMGVQWNDFGWNGTVNKHDYELLTNLTDDKMENWPFDYFYEGNQILKEADWIQYILDRPMVSDPGTLFNYNSGAPHLLSAILQNKTGMNTANFADKYLFTPLNITDYHWWNDSMGISNGGFGLWLRPIDMAKIGYLYLNNGTWNDTPIVPKEWVEMSTKGDEVKDNYGYLWWIDTTSDSTIYFANGLGGQRIIVIPGKNLVVTVTASDYHSGLPMNRVFKYIIAPLIYNETTTTDSTIPTKTSDDASFPLSLLGVLSFILLTIRYRKNKRK